jgi:S-adenosylmethionine:tRNA ribosyltransferase-isomerase
MLLTELDYNLPPERIAQRPLDERDASRMLLLDRRTGAWEDRAFRELPELVRGDELIVVNNARVIPARLLGRRVGVHSGPHGKSGKTSSEFLQSEIEVLLVRRLEANVWEGLVRPGRKVGVGEKIVFGDGALEAEVEARSEYGIRRLRFRAQGDFEEILNRLGHVPLPPYIRRADDSSDRERYQTLFASRAGAVAAPTAGLHFSHAILERLRVRKIEIVEITLDVGLGTFEPIRTDRLEDHPIHHESYEIPEATADAIERANRGGRPIVAIGTTAVFNPGVPKPGYFYIPAKNFAWSASCSQIFICRNRAFWRSSRRLPDAKMCCARTPTPSTPAIDSTATATAC